MGRELNEIKEGGGKYRMTKKNRMKKESEKREIRKEDV